MADQKVTTSTRSWAAEVAAADAMDSLDSPTPGGVVALEGKRPAPFYRFSNGRTFAAPKLPQG